MIREGAYNSLFISILGIVVMTKALKIYKDNLQNFPFDSTKNLGFDSFSCSNALNSIIMFNFFHFRYQICPLIYGLRTIPSGKH